MEPLFCGIRDLKQEKTRLEQKLKEMRAERGKQEKIRDVLKSKHQQLKDRNSKMRETLKVAQFKVSDTQSQLDRYQELADQKRGRIKEMNELKEKLECGVKSGESETDIAIKTYFEKIKAARIKFNGENARLALNEEEKEIQRVDGLLVEEANKLQQYALQIEETKANLEQRRKACEAFGFPEETQLMLLEMWSEYDKAVETECERVNLKHIELDEKLAELDNVSMEMS